MNAHVFLTQLVWLVVLLLVLVLNIIFMDWWERKMLGHVMVRYGPMHTGFHGLLQPFADMVKMLTKEDVVPRQADRLFFWLGPMIAVVPAFVALAVLPLGPGLVMVDLRNGLLFVVAMQTIMPFGYTLIGWAGHNKWSLVGALRSAAQLISYEIPMLLAALGVVMVAGSARLSDIVGQQGGVWYAFKMPLGFLLFLVTAVAEMNRTPFDMTEAESELVAGIHTEYSGMKFAFVLMAEYTAMLVGSWMIVVLFLGGWNLWPLPPSPVWLVLKVYLVQSFIILLRGTFPRMRMDLTMQMSWKWLIPAALANIMIVAVLALAIPGF